MKHPKTAYLLEKWLRVLVSVAAGVKDEGNVSDREVRKEIFHGCNVFVRLQTIQQHVQTRYRGAESTEHTSRTLGSSGSTLKSMNWPGTEELVTAMDATESIP